MKDYYSSFICEHTAEYTLVSRLTHILKEKFEIVIPIFPWLTREGGNLSKHIHRQDYFKILGLYARRPKISRSNEKILVKINPDLIRAAIEAKKTNIPMIAGCPLAKTFWELNENTECIWINLTEKTDYFYEIISEQDKFQVKNPTLDNEIMKSNQDIFKLINDNCEKLNLEIFTEAIRMIKAQSLSHYFIGGYKPVYFLLRNEKK